MKFNLSLAFILFATVVQAQYKQQFRGTVVDQVLQKPLAGATVTLDPGKRSAITDEEGFFRFADLPIGNYTLTISNIGFREMVMENIAINSGKETVLTIRMEALIKVEKEVVVTANSKKNRPINDMTTVSARAFTVEETQKYAASVNDPLRMVTVFPGVLAVDDGNNSIVIRGNSPSGLLWKMEGMEVPNPNHFSSAGISGGGISILSSQLLSNSDFVTSAFASEYGNALSGVFDLSLRKGNNEKREYNVQAGFLGLNVAAEGPFSKSYKGSYLVNYRYSTLAILNKIGIDISGGGANFQDLSYNVYLPTKRAGNFTLFGFGGISGDKREPELDSTKWETQDERYPYTFTANTAMSGATHTLLIGQNVSVKSGIGVSYTKNASNEKYIEDDLTIVPDEREEYITRKFLFNSTLNYKIGNKSSLRTGIIGNLIRYSYFNEGREHLGDPIKTNIDSKDNTATAQAFVQWQYRPTNYLTINTGLHYLGLALNNTSSVEPRVSVKWNINNRSSIAVGYGLHSQLQPLGLYFSQFKNPDGSYTSPNKNLEFGKAHHYVLSFSQRITKNFLAKTEFYYQDLFNIAVSAKPGSTYSALNVDGGFSLDPLVNKGTGKNYGVEISLERYLYNNFYLTANTSLYQSKYTALDGIERNSRFNGNYILTLISGKDFVSSSKRRTYGVNIKVIAAGGLRTTPIDLAASQQKGYTVYEEDKAYSLQNPAYFRTDLRLSVKWNKKYITSTLSLDFQNLTNRQNVYSQYYSKDDNKVLTSYQLGLIPVLNYKIDF